MQEPVLVNTAYAADKTEPVSLENVLISDIYFNVPRSRPFIQKCNESGKLWMSQLTEADFDAVAALKGIGVASAEKLRKIYIQFMENPRDFFGGIETDQDLNPLAPISRLPLPPRAKNCLQQAGICSLEELLVLSKDELMNIRSMGEKTCQEILAFRDASAFSKLEPSALRHLKDICPENKPIPISLLHHMGISLHGIDLLENNGFLTVGDLCHKGLTLQEYSFVHGVQDHLAIPVPHHFENAIASLKDNVRISMARRCHGATLGEIGKEINVTRERVRQILMKTCRQLTGIAQLVAGMLLSLDKATFSFSDLAHLLHSEESAMYCKLVLQESDYVRYLKFSDRFVKTSVCGNDLETRLKECIGSIIGEGINFYDNLEFITSELKKHDLDYFHAADIMNFLIHNGYRFYGDYVTKGIQPYAIICHDAVRKFFEFDIKLDSDEDNKDMTILRQIIAKHYQGVPLPSKNRALTAAMTRDPFKFILSGRGRYCPIEKVIYSIPLFEEIYQFITNSSQASFYYSELFSHFQERLLQETNILNSNFLHGMLKFLYPNEFDYERDLMSKAGKARQDIDDRLSGILLQNRRCMTRAEIKQSIPGINDFVIAFSAMRLPEVIQWDYNEFNHIDNIKITPEERHVLFHMIKTQTKLHGGYCSDMLLFNAVKGSCKEFLLKNEIKNQQNLYYIVSYLFEGDYRFRRPHILSKDFPVQTITAAKIAQILLGCETSLNYHDYFRLASDLEWASGTVYTIFSDLEKEFIRISENDYIRKTSFDISPSLIHTLSMLLQEMTREFGYYPLSSVSDYDTFPPIPYRWNGFLLESLITEFDTGFRILSTQFQDRRFQRGIIVPERSSYATFEDLVVGTLLSDHRSTLSEGELLTFLKKRRLIITNKIPLELYKCPKMPFKNELFTIKE